ncbi:hypothetical protein AAVH_00021 [Aphelenchoides avenae]|nr:hypothetical protein AAVH_00021 [Aphelenchus avenae]
MTSQTAESFSVSALSAPQQSSIQITLAEEERWREFSQFTNEMIVTKAGRWKFSAGEWQPAGQADIREPSNVVTHHDQAQNGEYWMKNTVSFDRVKLTNRPQHHGGSEISLCSMHKYQPVVHITRWHMDESGTNRQVPLTVIEPNYTEFIAVTAYQNQQIIDLKVRYNPFAKGFREGSARKRRASDSPPEDMYSALVKRASFDYLANNNIMGFPFAQEMKFPFAQDVKFPFAQANCSAFSQLGMPAAAAAQTEYPAMQQAMPETGQQMMPPQMMPFSFPYMPYWPTMLNAQPMTAAGKEEPQF